MEIRLSSTVNCALREEPDGASLTLASMLEKISTQSFSFRTPKTIPTQGISVVEEEDEDEEEADEAAADDSEAFVARWWR
jgi:hypothetical protein